LEIDSSDRVRSVASGPTESPSSAASKASRRRFGTIGEPSRLVVVLVVALLALVPLGLATWTYGHAFRQDETARQDTQIALALSLVAQRLDKVEREALGSAQRLARSKAVTAALVAHDRKALQRLARHEGRISLSVVEPGQVGQKGSPQSLVRRVTLVGPRGQLGQVVARVPLTSALLADIARGTGVTLAPLRAGYVVGGPFAGLKAVTAIGRSSDIRFGGQTYRARGLVSQGPLGVLALDRRNASADAAARKRQELTFVAGTVTVILLALLALFVGLGRQRARPRERRSLVLVGEAFAAAHDERALLPVILDTSVSATGARGGLLVWNGEEVARRGSVRRPSNAVVFALDDVPGNSRLVLFPPRGGFGPDDWEAARSLVAQGRIALEKARHHTIVQQQAVTDDLTALPNRRRFLEELRRELTRAERSSVKLALVLFDIDDFKRINDRCGHAAGDAALRSLAQVISDRLRGSDAAARLGGEEFAVLLPATEEAGAVSLAESLRLAISNEVGVAGVTWPITASFGVAVLSPGEVESEFMRRADEALYRAKAAGKNRVVVGEMASPTSASAVQEPE
jgi:diguanylate cyclase (GGDEF)-like protein